MHSVHTSKQRTGQQGMKHVN